MDTQYDITILTVNYHTSDLLKYNINSLLGINNNLKIKHVVTANTSFHYNSPNVQILPKVSEDEVSKEYNHNINLTTMKLHRRQWHHAMGLQNGLKTKINSRFLLTLDPDCFILYRLEDTINYMKQNNFMFLGVKLLDKADLVNKPYITSLFIDLERFPLEYVDFRPKFSGLKSKLKHANCMTRIGHPIYEHYNKNNYKVLDICHPRLCSGCRDIMGYVSDYSQQPLFGRRTETFFLNNIFWGFHLHAHKHDIGRLRFAMSDNEVLKTLNWLEQIGCQQHEV